MKKDHTLAVNELRRYYNELTAHRKSIRAIVKAEYEAQIDLEIERRIKTEELKFANHLAAVKERDGIPVSIIQDHVLRTRTWSRWEKWRDLAGLEPEMVAAESGREAKRKAEAHFLWLGTTDPYTFDVVKDQSGLTVTPVLAKVEAATPKDWQGKEDFFAEVPRGDYPEFGGLLAFQRYVNAEVKRAFEAGEIPEIISEYDALQRTKKNNENA